MKKTTKPKFLEYLSTLITVTGSNTRQQYVKCFDRWLKHRIECEVLGIKEDKVIVMQFLEKHNKVNVRGKLQVNSLYTGFVKHLFICYNLPLKDIPRQRRLSTEEIERSFLTKEEIVSCITTLVKLRDPFHALTIRILFETGLRVSELMDVTGDDIDWETNSITGIGKGGKPFRVFLSIKSMQKLKQVIELRKKLNPFLAYIFRYDDVKHSDRKFRYGLHKLEKLVGIKKLTPHRFRKSLGRYVRVEKGWDLEQVRKLLRHSSLNTTSIYSKATHEEIGEKVKKDLFNEVK